MPPHSDRRLPKLRVMRSVGEPELVPEARSCRPLPSLLTVDGAMMARVQGTISSAHFKDDLAGG